MTTAVRQQSKARLAARLVLLTIADYAGDDGAAWPSISTLKDDTLLSERAVQTALTALVNLGELAVETNAGPRGCNRYRVLLNPRKLCTPANSAPPQTLPGPPQILRETPANFAPEPLENHQEPPPPPTPTAAVAEVDEIDVPGITARVQSARTAAGLSIARWRDRAIGTALTKAVAAGMAVDVLEPALLVIALDGATNVPGRLAVPGPWWDVGHVVDLDARRRTTDLPYCETHLERGKVCRGCAADRKASTA